MSSQPVAARRCPICQGGFDAGDERCPEDGILLLAPDARTGTSIDGKFQVLDILGQAAAGVLFKARQTGFARLVALKLLKMTGSDGTAVMRFKRKAHVFSRLRHPNIEAVCAFGDTTEGDAYLACELIDGKRLSDMPGADSGRDLRFAREAIVKLCAALTSLHKNGIVHRDIKKKQQRRTRTSAIKPRTRWEGA